ncbi:hypothetical protein ACGFMK_09765 [Amycolatopsis sp. NPDC049252]|uniref:hypothetical protein n=1 Tax=Amycolatopsis sp. NPDC049252 TaxID=3363933 RepID=UPI0037239438
MRRRALLRRRARRVLRWWRSGRHRLDAGGCRAGRVAWWLSATRRLGRWPLRWRALRRRDTPEWPVVTQRAIRVVVGSLVADRTLVVHRPVVPGRALAGLAVVLDRLLGAGRPIVLDRRLRSGRSAVARFLARRAVVPGRTSVADRTLVARRAALADGLVFAGQLAGVAVARRLAAAALRRWRRRLLLRRGLAADRLRRSGRPLTPLRGRGAFAPRTTRTLGW